MFCLAGGSGEEDKIGGGGKAFRRIFGGNMWYLYMLRCRDGSLYTGITTDVEKRLEAHRSGKGAKYTRGRGPLELVYQETCGDHSQALKRELAIKALTRQEKEAMLAQVENSGKTD